MHIFVSPENRPEREQDNTCMERLVTTSAKCHKILPMGPIPSNADGDFIFAKLGMGRELSMHADNITTTHLSEQ